MYLDQDGGVYRIGVDPLGEAARPAAFDGPPTQPRLVQRDGPPVAVEFETPPQSHAAQNAEQAPEWLFGDRRRLAGSQHEAKRAETLYPVLVKLSDADAAGLRESGRQPRVAGDEAAHQIATDEQDFPFSFIKFHHRLNVPDEPFRGGGNWVRHIKLRASLSRSEARSAPSNIFRGAGRQSLARNLRDADGKREPDMKDYIPELSEIRMVRRAPARPLVWAPKTPPTLNTRCERPKTPSVSTPFPDKTSTPSPAAR
jgi:hypothetical protein